MEGFVSVVECIGHSDQRVISSAVRCLVAPLSWIRCCQQTAGDGGRSDHWISVSEKFQRSMFLQQPPSYFLKSLLTSKSQRKDHIQ